MITIRKLASLAPDTRRRKIARLLEAWERDPDESLVAYLGDLALLVRADEELPESVRLAADALLGTLSGDVAPGAAPRHSDAPRARANLVRTVNALRHALGATVGYGSADWDLRSPGGVAGAGGAVVSPLSGVVVYLESLRSPFNVGSIVRSAAAFGVPRVVLSPDCPATDHPRLVRSAMGSERLVAVRRGSAEDAARPGPETPETLPIIALELGGEPLAEFSFPESGVLALGSEELGVSPELLERAERRVSIPMAGGKASINVGVACGIALAFWSAARARTGR